MGQLTSAENPNVNNLVVIELPPPPLQPFRSSNKVTPTGSQSGVALSLKFILHDYHPDLEPVLRQHRNGHVPDFHEDQDNLRLHYTLRRSGIFYFFSFKL